MRFATTIRMSLLWRGGAERERVPLAAHGEKGDQTSQDTQGRRDDEDLAIFLEEGSRHQPLEMMDALLHSLRRFDKAHPLFNADAIEPAFRRDLDNLVIG